MAILRCVSEPFKEEEDLSENHQSETQNTVMSRLGEEAPLINFEWIK